MNTKVKVSANAEGAIVNISENNSEYGHIRVTQTRAVFDDQGWVRKSNLSALIAGTVEDLKSMELSADSEIAGKIVIKESLTPFNKKNPEKDAKIAGKSGIPCTFDGQAIYRKTFFTEDADAQDVLVKHNNDEAIRTAYLAEKGDEVAAGEEEKEFDL